MKKKRIGLIIGRFQPFHLGHLYLIQEALKHADKVIIAIGSTNVEDENNPIQYSARVKMLKRVIEKEGLNDRILKIVASPDDPDDDVWLEKLLLATGKFDFVIGNNDWVNGILKAAGYKIVEIPLLNRDKYQGKFVRDQFRQHREWQENVPSYLSSEISKTL